MLTDRVESTNDEWDFCWEKVRHQYKQHQTQAHGMKPKDAHDAKSATDININLLLHAQRKFKHPQLEAGNWVRVVSKKKTSMDHAKSV